MDPLSLVQTAVSLAVTIADTVKLVQENKEECQDLGKRVARLQHIVDPLRNETKQVLEAYSSTPTLQALAELLKSVNDFLSQFTQRKKKAGIFSNILGFGSDAFKAKETEAAFISFNQKLDSILIELSALRRVNMRDGPLIENKRSARDKVNYIEGVIRDFRPNSKKRIAEAEFVKKDCDMMSAGDAETVYGIVCDTRCYDFPEVESTLTNIFMHYC